VNQLFISRGHQHCQINKAGNYPKSVDIGLKNGEGLFPRRARSDVKVCDVRKSAVSFLITILVKNCQSENKKIKNLISPRRNKRDVSKDEKNKERKNHVGKAERHEIKVTRREKLVNVMTVFDIEHTPFKQKKKKSKKKCKCKRLTVNSIQEFWNKCFHCDYSALVD
jgi:hypothetical protein